MKRIHCFCSFMKRNICCSFPGISNTPIPGHSGSTWPSSGPPILTRTGPGSSWGRCSWVAMPRPSPFSEATTATRRWPKPPFYWRKCLNRQTVGSNIITETRTNFSCKPWICPQDTQQKYNSRASQLYREKLHSLAAQAMRIHGTKVRQLGLIITV